MAAWNDLADEAERMPFGTARTATLLRAIDRADADGAEEEALGLRLDVTWAADRSGEPLVGLAAFAWCRARFDADPERFASFEWRINWCHKWMPLSAVAFPAVSMARVTDMVDDLERRHVAAGGGRRQAIALRMNLADSSGVGAPIADLLADWRESARTSLADCPACEARDEAAALVELGRFAEAVALVLPYVRGEQSFCDGGPASLCVPAIGLLADAGLVDDARQAFARAARQVDGDASAVDMAMRLASLQSRAGSADLARRLLRANLGNIPAAGSPESEGKACGWAALALDRLPGEEDLALDGSTLASLATFLDIDEAELGTVAGLRQHLLLAAGIRARAFDERNGNTWVSERLARRLALGDFDGVSFDPGRIAQPPSAVAPAPRSVDTDDSVEDRDQVDELLAATPDELDGWCRGRFDAWDPAAATAGAARVWSDPAATVDLRAAAAVWLAGSEVASIDDLQSVADDGRVGPLVRARILAAIAREMLDTDPERAHRIGAEALAAVDGQDLAAEDRILLTANVARLLWESGSPDVATLLHSVEPVATDVAARAAVQVAGLRLDLASARADADADDLGARADAVVALAEPELPVPWAVHWTQRGAGVLADVGRLDDAAALLGRTLAATAQQPAALPMRYQGFLTLADVESARGDLDGALRAQRGAIDEVRPLGVSPMLGWARRGLAFQLHQAGRLDESSTQFAEAASLLDDAGDVANALRLQLEQARVELELDEPGRARRLADAVLDRIAEVADEEGRKLLTWGLDVAGQGAGRSGDHDEAARRYTELADQMTDPDDLPAMAWSMAAMAHAQAGDPEAAEQAFDRALASCDDGRTPEWARSMVEGRHARVLWWRDANAEAAELARRAADRANDFGDRRLAVDHLLLLAAVQQEDEAFEAMERTLREALGAVADPELADLAPVVHGALARALEALGRPDEAATHAALAAGPG